MNFTLQVDALVGKYGEERLLAMVRKKYREAEARSQFPIQMMVAAKQKTLSPTAAEGAAKGTHPLGSSSSPPASLAQQVQRAWAPSAGCRALTLAAVASLPSVACGS